MANQERNDIDIYVLDEAIVHVHTHVVFLAQSAVVWHHVAVVQRHHFFHAFAFLVLLPYSFFDVDAVVAPTVQRVRPCCEVRRLRKLKREGVLAMPVDHAASVRLVSSARSVSHEAGDDVVQWMPRRRQLGADDAVDVFRCPQLVGGVHHQQDVGVRQAPLHIMGRATCMWIMYSFDVHVHGCTAHVKLEPKKCTV
jgi:hypothetical protein